MRANTIFKLELTFNDFLDVDENLESGFNKLSEVEQNHFIAKNHSAVNGGMNGGMDYSEVMKIVADILHDELQAEHKRKLIELGECISLDNDHDNELQEAYDALVAQSKIDGGVQADNVVTMWEKLEGEFTVNQLLKHIV